MSARVHDPWMNARLTGYTRNGFAARYHAYRPRPPEDLVGLLLQLAQTTRPDLVVDLGCGTGLSTRLWAAQCRRVIGIEPLDEMRSIATADIHLNVELRAGVAQDTGLPAEVADIATCSQSLHHMEPTATFLEVHRILRPGGVFAAYDYEWPPVVHWEAERAFFAFMDRVRELRRRRSVESHMQRWDKAGHLDRMRDSGVFRLVRELFLHHREPCTAERWVGFALTIGDVAPVLELGASDADLGLDEFRRVAGRVLGDNGLPWHVSYRVRVGIK